MKYFVLFLFSSAVFFSGCATDNTASNAAKDSLRKSQIPFNQTAFIRAASEGDVEIVNLFLTAGIDKSGLKNSNALAAAVAKNHIKVVDALLAAGYPVDIESYNGTPLCIAAANNYLETAKKLISAGADADYKYESGTPLYLAAEKNHPEMVKLLLNAKADPDITVTTPVKTPLMAAAYNNADEVVKLLLDNGADIHLRDYAGHSALDIAVYAGNSNCAALIIDSKGFDSDKDALPAMLMAISKNNIEIMKKLIKKGADVNAVNGQLPILSWAIKTNRIPAAELLIEKGADTAKTDTSGMTPMDYAIRQDSPGIKEKLQQTTKPAVTAEPEIVK